MKEPSEMTYSDIASLKESREGKAMSALTDALNSMSFDSEAFARSVRFQHRTLQQGVMRACLAVIREMARDDFGTDPRNQSAHDTARSIMETGVLDSCYLPFT